MKFELHNNDSSFRKGIIFLCGRGKTLESFNRTSSGKVVDLEAQFRRRAVTCIVQFDEDDLSGYLGTVEEDHTLEPLVSQLRADIKWLLVASSMGAYFACLFPVERAIGYVFIDPVARLPHLDESRLPVRVHLKLTPSLEIDWVLWDKVTSYHSKSAVLVHWNCSHLIHCDEPAKIAESIKSLLK